MQEAPKPAEILYEENLLSFDDTRKWKEQLVVVRANYSLECHDNYEVTNEMFHSMTTRTSGHSTKN